MKRYFIIFLALLSVSSACGRSGGSNRNQLLLVSDEEMNVMGNDAYQDILSQSRLSNDWQLTSELRDIGQRIAAASDVDFEWEFNVLDDEQANAFCLPGGKVAVYSGIVPFAQNNAGLAAVMGHEVAHALLRHSAERVSQDLLLKTGLSLATLSYAHSAYKDLIAAALGIGTQFGLEMPFSRFQESEADRVGLDLMARAGYDPREAIGLWERMAAGQGSRVPELLSTHPDPAKRAKELNNHMNAALQIYAQSPLLPTKPL